MVNLIRTSDSGAFLKLVPTGNQVVNPSLASYSASFLGEFIVGYSGASYSAITSLDYCFGGNVTASGENAPNETAAKAFDDSTATKWLVFTSTGWIAYNFSGGQSNPVNYYSITSANDSPTRDPKDWQFQGSNNGTSWTTLDTRTGETFASRFLKKEYTFTNTTSYPWYRLNITANNGDTRTQLSEIEMKSSSNPLFIATANSLFKKTAVFNEGIALNTNNPQSDVDLRGSVVINEDGDDKDFRIEGDTIAHLFLTDASTDRIGIGTSLPSYRVDITTDYGTNNFNALVKGTSGEIFPWYIRLQNNGSVDIKGNSTNLKASNGYQSYDYLQLVAGSHSAQALGNWQWRSGTTFNTGAVGLRFSADTGSGGTFITFNENNVDWNYRFKTNGDDSAIWVDGGLNAIGMGNETPLAKLHITGISNKSVLRVDSYASQTTIAIDFRNSNASPAYQLAGTGNQTNFFNETTIGTSRLVGQQMRKVRHITNADSPFTPNIDHIILCNASTASIVVNLPASSTASGTIFDFKKIDSTSNPLHIYGFGLSAVDQSNVTGSSGIGFGDTGNNRDYMTQGFIPAFNNVYAIAFRIDSKDANPDFGYKVWIDDADSNFYPVNGIGGIGGETIISNGSIVEGALTQYPLTSIVSLVAGNRYVIGFAPWDTVLNSWANSYHDIISSTSNNYTSGVRAHLDASYSNATTPDSGNDDILFRTYGYTFNKIDGANSKTITTQYNSLRIVCDGSNWYII